MKANLILLFSLFAMGCARSYIKPSDENYIQAVEAPEQKVGTKLVGAGASKRDLIKYILRLSNRDAAFTAEDQDFFNQLPLNPAPGSFEEAALVVGGVRSCLDTPVVQGTAAATAAQTSSPLAKPPSLEQIMQAKGVNLAKALDNNVIIKTYKVYQLVQAGLNASNSQAFNDSVGAVIQGEAAQWAALLRQPDQASAAVGTSTTTAVTPEPVLPRRRYSTADLRQGDSTLMEAERLAERGNFKDAIALIKQINQEDPFYPAAQERIREYSNKAVLALRQKAARAFQNALPVGDVRAKTAYLEEARRHLEEALQDYPNADQLNTVKENLAVITRDLNKLGKQKGSSSQQAED